MIENLKINEKLKQDYYEKGLWGTETLIDAWSASAAKYGPKTYITDDCGSSYTYTEIDEKAARLATWLREVGIETGDVVSFQMPKWAEFCIIYIACLKVGAVMYPLSINCGETEIIYALNKAKTSAFICPTTYRGISVENIFLRIEDQIPTLKAVLFVDREIPTAHEAYPVLSQVLESHEPYTGLAGSASDDVACILTTSGTTGPPKLVLTTHNTILFSERSYLSPLGLTSDDVMWMPSPLNHATGFFHGMISVMLLGGSTVLQQEYSAKDAVDLINQYGCTWSHGATPFIYDLLSELDQADRRVPSLRLFLCGGAPVPSALVQHAFEYDVLLCESYGSTESCPHIYVPPEHCVEWNGAWSGIPYEHIEVRVVDENHQVVPAGVQGEEASRGPHMFVGYLDDEERTNKALDDEGWFYSGDLCYMDEQGRIRINGRKKEIIIRGGKNISAHEIDELLSGCPGIGQHATIGMPDERLGERICTFVVPSGNPPTLDEVIAYLDSIGVPKRLRPERLEFIDKIPLTATGKVKRYELAKELLFRMTRTDGE